jgi:flagellar biogenesis protein FliO
MSFFSALFGPETPLIGRVFLALILVLGIIAAAFLIFRRISPSLFNNLLKKGGAETPRLGLVSYYPLDTRRQLVIVKRDDKEHLLLIGGPNDLVIETGIEKSPQKLKDLMGEQPIKKPALKELMDKINHQEASDIMSKMDSTQNMSPTHFSASAPTINAPQPRVPDQSQMTSRLIEAMKNPQGAVMAAPTRSNRATSAPKIDQLVQNQHEPEPIRTNNIMDLMKGNATAIALATASQAAQRVRTEPKPPVSAPEITAQSFSTDMVAIELLPTKLN